MRVSDCTDELSARDGVFKERPTPSTQVTVTDDSLLALRRPCVKRGNITAPFHHLVDALRANTGTQAALHRGLLAAPCSLDELILTLRVQGWCDHCGGVTCA